MDEGVYVPTPGQGGSVGAGQSFTILNFVQRNSLGLGTDTLVPTLEIHRHKLVLQPYLLMIFGDL